MKKWSLFRSKRVLRVVKSKPGTESVEESPEKSKMKRSSSVLKKSAKETQKLLSEVNVRLGETLESMKRGEIDAEDLAWEDELLPRVKSPIEKGGVRDPLDAPR